MYVILALPLELTPFNPPRPTWLVTKMEGTVETIWEQLSIAATTKTPLVFANCCFATFDIVAMERTNPSTGQKQLAFSHTFKFLPLTPFDKPEGLTWCLVPTTWFFPTGAILDIMISEIENTKKVLQQNEISINNEKLQVQPVEKPPLVLATSIPKNVTQLPSKGTKK